MAVRATPWSHPTGVRGLKLFMTQTIAMPVAVAPHWGAWIEIRRQSRNDVGRIVAPHWGAWIEITANVVPPAGTTSHPTGVRGLKSRNSGGLSRPIESHPTGVRGLKYIENDRIRYF